MLGSILSKESCAQCKFCCVFRRQSLWELPRVPVSFAEKYPEDVNGKPVKYIFGEEGGKRYAAFDLTGDYKTDDPEEEAPCPFLDPGKGCTLTDEDKPFNCKIWPFRYMEMPGGDVKVVMADSCPEMCKIPAEKLLETVDNGLGDAIEAFAKDRPYFINSYHDGYSVIK